MRVLNLEDSAAKHSSIKKELREIGVTDMEWARNLEEGVSKIEQAIEKDVPFELVVTDMNFPLKRGEKSYGKAGEEVIKELKKREIGIPVILCSSVRYRVPGMYGCVHYSERADWENELRELIQKM